MKIWLKSLHFSQSVFKNFSVTRETHQKLTKIFTMLPKWLNFAKSGHTTVMMLTTGVIKKVVQNNFLKTSSASSFEMKFNYFLCVRIFYDRSRDVKFGWTEND